MKKINYKNLIYIFSGVAWILFCAALCIPTLSNLFLSAHSNYDYLKFILGIFGVLLIPRKFWLVGLSMILFINGAIGISFTIRSYMEYFVAIGNFEIPTIEMVSQTVFSSILILGYFRCIKFSEEKII